MKTVDLYLFRKFKILLKMAKVKFSALISEMRNKLNGSVFSRNRGGSILRTKVTPTNPMTTAQVAVRSRLAYFAQKWRTLTEDERLSFNSAVTQWARTDIFGDVVNPSGITLFIRLNINITNAGGTEITSCPAPVGADALELTQVIATESTQNVDFTFRPDTIPVGHAMVVEATPNLSPGISNANSQFRQVGVFGAGVLSPINIGPDYVLKFGPVTEGQKLFVRAKFVNVITGETSQSLTTSSIIVA